MIPNTNLGNRPLNGLKIVFTGFRNKSWEKIITENGGEITSIVSKNTSFLVCEDIDDTSSKINKAKQLNIQIYLKNDFKNHIGNTYNIVLD